MKMRFSNFKTWPVALTLIMTSATSLNLGAEEPRHDFSVLDHPYGLALYQYYQDQQQAAITEIDVGKFRLAFKQQAEDAELLLGGLYFSYGLADEAEKIFNQMMQEEKAAATQDRIWFNLARVQYERNNFEQSAELLSRIEQQLPSQREQQKQHLLSSLYLNKQQLELAEQATKKIDQKNILRAYAEFNLSVSQIANGQVEQGQVGLKNLQRLSSNNEEVLGLLDSSQLALGISALKQENNIAAIENFSKVRLSGPISNKALLGIGWAWNNQSDHDKAIGYWQALQKKNQLDGATAESILAIPYAWEQKGNKNVAIQYYNQAATIYDQKLQELDAIAQQIESNQLINQLVQKRIIEDSTITELTETELPDSTSNYLYELIADKKFHQQLRNYQELVYILDTLLKWDSNIPVLNLMLEERQASFDQKRPIVEKTSSHQQLEELIKQRDRLAKSVKQIELDNDYLALANEDEVDYIEQLDELQNLIELLQDHQDVSEEKEKYFLLKGILHYQISIDYPSRYWRIKRELELLDRALVEATESSRSLKASASLNEKNLQQFKFRIEGQDSEITKQLTLVDNLLSRQQDYINELAIRAIEQQKLHITQLRISARYSLARLYDELVSSESDQ